MKTFSENFLHSVKWGIDWIMKSIVIDEDMNIKEVFVQVGDPDKEHKELVRIFCKVSNDFGNGNFCDVARHIFSTIKRSGFAQKISHSITTVRRLN